MKKNIYTYIIAQWVFVIFLDGTQLNDPMKTKYPQIGGFFPVIKYFQ